jgi:hypothetical protein
MMLVTQVLIMTLFCGWRLKMIPVWLQRRVDWWFKVKCDDDDDDDDDDAALSAASDLITTTQP